jgi:hypothetical protein
MGRKKLPQDLIQKLGTLDFRKGTFLNYPVFLQVKKLLKKGCQKRQVAILTGVTVCQVQMIKKGKIDITRWKKTSKTIKK